MKSKLRCFKYTSKDSNKTNKEKIRRNFDAGVPVQEDDYDLLIATDAISEGFNLHRAGIVFNYDIPYNPTRVIQRVGRINRVNKKVFDELFIYNFFPTATGEMETRTKAISTLKMFMIHALVGEDTKVLTRDEELGSYFAKKFREAAQEDETPSWDVEFRNFLGNLKIREPEKMAEANSIPRRVRIRRLVKMDSKGVLVFAKKGEEYKFKISIDGNPPESLSPSKAIRLFEAEHEEKAEPVGPAFEKSYKAVITNLFEKKTQVPKDKGKAQAIQKIQVLLTARPQFKDYFEDLLRVMRDLDALPEGFARQIRAINEKTLDEDLGELRKDVNPEYLAGLIAKANQVGEGEEVLILSEELA